MQCKTYAQRTYLPMLLYLTVSLYISQVASQSYVYTVNEVGRAESLCWFYHLTFEHSLQDANAVNEALYGSQQNICIHEMYLFYRFNDLFFLSLWGWEKESWGMSGKRGRRVKYWLIN